MKKKFENIRSLREGSNKTQAEIAEILGIAQNTYSQYETAIIQFDADMLIVLADYYGTSIDFLLDRTK